MTVTIFPGVPLTGTLDAIPSKSAAHRLMICAALASASLGRMLPFVHTSMVSLS